MTTRIWLRWDGPRFSEVTPPYQMRVEPHRLIIETGGSYLVGRQCGCRECSNQPSADVSETGPATLAAIIAAHIEAEASAPELEVVLVVEMTRPLADGSTTHALLYAQSLVDAVTERGISGRILLPVHPDPHPEGTWLRVVRDSEAAGLHHLIVEGMVGQVVSAQWVPCTPGVSVMTCMAGRSEPAAYEWGCLVPMEATPTAEELARAKKLTATAVDLYQATRGWRGLVSVGSTVMTESRARAEIRSLITKLPELWRAGRASDGAGLGKRLGKLLRGFAVHPRGAVLATAATELDGGRRTAPRQDLLDAIMAWLLEQDDTAAAPSEHG